MSVQAIITQVAVLQGAITGIKKAWDNAPDSINEFPCFVNFPDTADITRIGGDLRRTRHLIKMQLFVGRADLATAETLARPFLALTLAKFDVNMSLNSTCDRSSVLHAAYGGLTYAGQQYLGWSFDLEAWEDEVITFAL